MSQTQNAEGEGRHIVGGFGATMMLHATIAALTEMILKVSSMWMGIYII